MSFFNSMAHFTAFKPPNLKVFTQQSTAAVELLT
jgi:hypothetical protein